MAAVFGEVPNFLNGVSQQAPQMRLPSQSETVKNVYPTVVDGGARRPPSQFMARLGEEYPGAFTHIMLRDDNEKYVLVIETDGTPHVFDFDGIEKSITNNSGTYLSVTNPAKNLRALTVADTTFLVNRKKIVEVGTTKSPARYPGECLINVMAGNYGKTYQITINGVVAAKYKTPDGSSASHSPYIDTSFIAASLVGGGAGGVGGGAFGGLTPGTVDSTAVNLIDTLSPSGSSPWRVGRYGHVIRILNTTDDFTLGVDDGYGSRAMAGLKDKVQKFSDLSTHGEDGITFEIIGRDGLQEDDYYVAFEKTFPENYTGVWRESVGKDVRLGLKASTMPHKLVRNADGTFTINPIEWDGRVCGDEEKVPDPSFVGQAISDVFFHRNRLGLLTEENVVLSASGSFYQFYRTTLLALLDTDPIDIAVSHIKVSLLHHAVPFNNVLLLFSDFTQFALKGNELLTPKTAHMDPLTELTSSPVTRPVPAGNSLYFVGEKDGFAQLNEYFLDKTIESAESDNVAAHAPNFVPSGVHSLVASSDLNMIAMATSGAPDRIFVYTFLWNGQEKIQSAWMEWSFADTEIVNLAFDRNNLVALIRKAGELQLMKMDCEQGTLESIYLDGRYLTSSGSYIPDAGYTRFILPFTVPDGLIAVAGHGGSLPFGRELPYTTTFPGPGMPPFGVGFGIVYIEGDLEGQPVYFGTKFTSEIELSEQFYRDQQRAAIVAGRLAVRAMDLTYDRTSFFKVIVEAVGRDPIEYPFNGWLIGSSDTLLGTFPQVSGRFSFPIMSRSDRVKIKLVNDSWLPSSFISAKWKGVFNPNSRQM
jgi:hypothetical protein